MGATATALCLVAFALAHIAGQALAASPVAIVASGGYEPHSISTVDTASGSVVGAPIQIATAPYGIWVEPSGRHVYVLSPFEQHAFGAGTLSIVDLADRRVVDRISLYAGALYMTGAPSGRVIYVAHSELNVISVVDIETRVVRMIPVMSPSALASDPAGDLLYVVSRDDIVVFRTADLLHVRTMTPGFTPRALTVTRDGRQLVVLDHDFGITGALVLLSAVTGQSERRIGIGAGYVHITLDGASRIAYVSGNGSDVKAVDLQTSRVSSATTGRGQGGGSALTLDERQLWVMNPFDKTVTVVETGAFQVIRTIEGLPGASTYGRFMAPPMPPAGSATVVEFYNVDLDHYFMTGLQEEIDGLDRKRHLGWGRTGQFFFSVPGSYPVCRFYGLPSAGLNSHFYSASSEECSAVRERFSSAWLHETDAAFYIGLPNLDTGECPVGTVAVWRLWNRRIDSNHRYTTNASIRQAMLDQGYVAEGYGPGATAMCAKSY